MTSIKCSIPTGFQVLPCSTRTVAGMLDFTGPIPVDSGPIPVDSGSIPVDSCRNGGGTVKY